MKHIYKNYIYALAFVVILLGSLWLATEDKSHRKHANQEMQMELIEII